MRIGVVREIKAEERRVGMTPHAVASLVGAGHRVQIESGAGLGSGFSDAQYTGAGAELTDSADEVFSQAQLLVKVKEPIGDEPEKLRQGQLLFTYLHLAAAPQLATQLMEKGVTAIAYETVTDAQGRLPLLTPMSKIAGRVAVQAGAHHLEGPHGGCGVLLGQVAGVPAGRVLIVGGGVVGAEAAKVALGMGASVTVLDKSLPRLAELETLLRGRASLEFASNTRLRELLPCTDLLVGAVLVPGAAAPRLLDRDAIATMAPGSVLVDVAIDQGGCFATSKPTTHRAPVYCVADVIHYCVANMPSAVARTSTMALSHATLPYIHELARLGCAGLSQHEGLRNGVNIHNGRVTHQNLADALGETYQPFG